MGKQVNQDLHFVWFTTWLIRVEDLGIGGRAIHWKFSLRGSGRRARKMKLVNVPDFEFTA